MRMHRALMVALIAMALCCLFPLAHASLPDPTWVAGVWDDGDHDDIVLLLTSVSAIASALLASELDGPTAVAALASIADDSRVLAPLRSLQHPRAPPIS
jgi:hypothetical protein